MAILKVQYLVRVTETIDWPDDELDDLTYDNLMTNLNLGGNEDVTYEEIINITKDNKHFNFE